ncbi:MAG: hypothetical protein K2L95_02540 [Alphaproteobacteria bacterium]|nr:hypothetical protein [Alphaproteobacteria bacterium]
MIKRLLAIFCLLFVSTAHAAEMVNVEYIHSAIKHHWGIAVPYNPALTNPRVAANMKYLLTAIDRANELQNNKTSYGTNATFATLAAADTVATNDAIKRFITQPFFITTTPTTTSFTFELSAQGSFTVTWGDGSSESIVKNDTEMKSYSHTYSRAGEYKIGFSGTATAYSTADPRTDPTAAIRFWKNNDIAAISGSLGAIFSTIGNGATAAQQPIFHNTFRECKNLTSTIPEQLFVGIHGAPAERMFAGTFQSTPFTGSIPADLFAEIKGAPAWAMFNNTFHMSVLTGTIPGNLFRGISGAPAEYMYSGTFMHCKNLTGEIPAGLFGDIHGAPVEYMYYGVLGNNPGLTGQIPENLFGDISGPAAPWMFYQSFLNDSGLTGPSARINGQYLYEIWPSPPENGSTSCYGNATGLSDYSTIPAQWK